jgi:PAS domain S-box-containing protein
MNTVGWLGLGILYSVAYAAAAFTLRHDLETLTWFRAGALLVPPLTAATIIFLRRQTWTGCQWLFWATIALGLTMSAIGLTGWATGELFLAQQAWLAWPAVFALFGNVAPLFALLAQPHRGSREPLAATTAVDIAGLAVVTGFLYSFFVTEGQSGDTPTSLLLVSELQSFVVAAALTTTTLTARETVWHDTYRRLSLGASVSFVMLTMSNVQSGYLGYGSAFVYDLTWILPFAFFSWAAAGAPSSATVEEEGEGTTEELARPRPWVIFAAVALLPFIDFGLRRLAPAAELQGVRDLSSAVAIISVLPLLVARIATERAELQQAGSTTRLLALVIEQAQDLILVFTPEGRFRHANDAFCRATGYTTEDLKDLSAQDLNPDDTQWVAELRALGRNGGTWHGVVNRVRRDGTSFPVAASVAALTDAKGAVAHVVSVERDISEERQLREQLIQSERLSAVGQLVAGVAHELNNPLQSVIGITELLIGAESRPDARRDLQQILKGGHRAARIVQSLHAFARRSAGGRAIADLNDIVRSTVELRAFELQTAGIAVHEDYAVDLPLVLANREEIQQVTLNLILNAEHAIRATGRRGSITLRTRGADDATILEVADDGPGVPADIAGRVFEPFFTTKQVGQGTGLGLSIGLGIAQAHGGTLALVRTSRGATFRLSLPSLPASVRAHVAPTEADSTAAGVA